MRWLLLLLLAQPAAAQEPPLDQMLGALRVAPDEHTAGLLEDGIKERWQSAASPAVQLLLSRALRELSEGAAGEAVDSFDAALDLQPDLLEAWRGRGVARAHLNDAAGAVKDLEEALRREPRDFLALQDLSRIAEQRGDLRGAIMAWQKFLEVDPRSPQGAERMRALRRLAAGQGA